MSKMILVAESGSDITPEMAQENGIVIVPMHVSFGGKTYDDGTFPTTEMFDYYKKHRELPRTSGCTISRRRLSALTAIFPARRSSIWRIRPARPAPCRAR